MLIVLKTFKTSIFNSNREQSYFSINSNRVIRTDKVIEEVDAH